MPKSGIALALGGGAVLGAAHVGVLKALDEHGIKINKISGTSIGALIATLYAFGKSPAELQQIVNELEWLDVSSFTLSRFGILSNDELGKKVNQILGKVSFSDAKIPLYLIATDLTEGRKVVLDKGDVAKAVMASSCIPGVFVPVEIDDMLLVDGGLTENVPVATLRDAGDDFIIGVDLASGRHYQRPQDIIDVIANAIDISIDHVTKTQSSVADLIIAPELSSYSRRDTSRIDELINEGYDSTCRLLEKAKS
ncbi:MAG: patatin [Desulfuromonas sp.]|nr:MAG: patatin [Desulfuromonas sp.]